VFTLFSVLLSPEASFPHLFQKIHTLILHVDLYYVFQLCQCFGEAEGGFGGISFAIVGQFYCFLIHDENSGHIV